MSPSQQDPAFEALLDYLKRSRGFDFTGYKRATLFRRLSKRMRELGYESFAAYTDHLEVHPDEFGRLFNTILINVTSFFRDSGPWKYLETELVPRLLERKGPDEPIRVWSAGCASGEEAYGLAVLFAEALGRDAFRERVKIYATDVDEEALEQARRAHFSPKDLEPLSARLRERYFAAANDHLAFREDLRRSVIFGRHDLVQDAPIGRIDLLVCRNVLMYLNADTQSRVLARLHFALGPDSYLFLGRAETLLAQGELFEPVDVQHRVFRRAPPPSMREHVARLGEANEEGGRAAPAADPGLRDCALDESPEAQLLVDRERTLVAANRAARARFQLAASDLGRPLQDLEVSYRPLELRSLLDRAQETGAPARADPVGRELPDGSREHLQVSVVPLGGDGAPAGACIVFRDASREVQLREELERAEQELEHANEELQSSNEELETTNEEIQSTNEELETTNEELQSSNEELETTNEELQSTNEELRSMNDELQTRTHELDRSNSYLQSVLARLPYAVVGLDRDLRVRLWEPKAEDIWGLRADEVEGESLLDLDIGLPVQQLAGPVTTCLAGEDTSELALDVRTRRGRSARCRVSLHPLPGESARVEGVVLLMLIEPQEGAAAPNDG